MYSDYYFSEFRSLWSSLQVHIISVNGFMPNWRKIILRTKNTPPGPMHKPPQIELCGMGHGDISFTQMTSFISFELFHYLLP